MASEMVDNDLGRVQPENLSGPSNSKEPSQDTELRHRHSSSSDGPSTATSSSDSSSRDTSPSSSSSHSAETVAENNANAGPQLAPQPLHRIPPQQDNVPEHHEQEPPHHQIRIHLRVNLNYLIAFVLIAVYAYTYFEIEHEINIRSKPLVPHSVGYVYKQPEDSASDGIKSHDSSVDDELDYLTKTLQGDDNPHIPSEYQLQSKYLSHILSNLNEMVRKFEVSNNITKPLGGIVELRTQKDDKPDYLKRLTDIVDELKVKKKQKKWAAEAEAAKDGIDAAAEKQKDEIAKFIMEKIYEQYEDGIVNERPEPERADDVYDFGGDDHGLMQDEDDTVTPRKEIAQIDKLMKKLQRTDYLEKPRRTNIFGRDIDERPNEDEGQVFALHLLQKILHVKKAEAEADGIIDVPHKHHSFQEDVNGEDEIKVDYVKHSFDDDPDDIELYDDEEASNGDFNSAKDGSVQVEDSGFVEEPKSFTQEVNKKPLDPATQKALEILNDFSRGLTEAATWVPKDGDPQLMNVDKIFSGLEEKFKRKQSESNPVFDHQENFDEDLSDDIITGGLLGLYKLKLWTRDEDNKYFRRQKEVMSRIESKYPMFKTMFLIQQLNEIMEDPESIDIPWEALIPKNVKSLEDLAAKKKAMVGFVSALKKDYASRDAHVRFLEQLAEL